MTSPAIPANYLELIGNTPMVRLNAVSDATGCEIYGKAEYAIRGARSKTEPPKVSLKPPKQAVSYKKVVSSLKAPLVIRVLA